MYVYIVNQPQQQTDWGNVSKQTNKFHYNNKCNKAL